MHSPPLLLLFDGKSGIAFSDHHFKLAQEMMVSHRRLMPRDQDNGNHLIIQGKLGRVLALYSHRLRRHCLLRSSSLISNVRKCAWESPPSAVNVLLLPIARTSLAHVRFILRRNSALIRARSHLHMNQNDAYALPAPLHVYRRAC